MIGVFVQSSTFRQRDCIYGGFADLQGALEDVLVGVSQSTTPDLMAGMPLDDSTARSIEVTDEGEKALLVVPFRAGAPAASRDAMAKAKRER